MEKICLNCKYWIQHCSEQSIKSLCLLSKMNHPKMKSSCGLYTTEDFSCNQFIEIVIKLNNIELEKE